MVSFGEGGFDANKVDPQEEFKAIPAGEYVAAIVKSEMKPTKKGNGSFLELTFQILDGPHKNRKIWERLNLDNPNADAVKIAKSQLSAICRAVNCMTPQDSSQLHDSPMVIKVVQKRNSQSGEIGNEIKTYKSRKAAFEQS